MKRSPENSAKGIPPLPLPIPWVHGIWENQSPKTTGIFEAIIGKGFPL